MYASMNIEISAMQAAADEVSEFLKVLSNRHRLLILCQLVEGERTVGELARLLGLRASNVSQHLALMRRDRLVVGRRDGHAVWYRIDSQPARNVLEVLYRTFCVPPGPS